MLASLLAALHALAAGSAWLGLSGAPLLLTLAGILLSAVWTVGDALLAWTSSIHAMELEENGSGRWTDGQGRAHPVQGTRASWVSAGLVVVGLRTSRWRIRWVVLLPDAAAPGPLRQFRTWLRWRSS